MYDIFHIRQNLDRHIQGTLDENYKDFLSKFYSTCNSLNETIFEIRWNKLIETFPSASNYLIGTLNKIKESWVKAFVCMVSKVSIVLCCFASFNLGKSNLVLMSFVIIF